MEIYIYRPNMSDVIKNSCPNTVKCKFFTEFLEIYEDEKFNTSFKKFIFCIDDEAYKMQLNALNISSILIVNSEFLIDIWKKFEKIFSNITLFNLLQNSVILFIGFKNEELLMELQFKVITMGGGSITEYNIESQMVTHVVPYRINIELKEIVDDFVHIPFYTPDWIEYYWKCLNFYSLYKPDNLYLKKSFKPKCFMNCKMNLFGFNYEDLSGIALIVVANGGSLYQLKNIDLIDFVIVPNEFKQLDDYRTILQSVPKNKHSKVVYLKWLTKSVNDSFLVETEAFQVICDNHCDLEVVDKTCIVNSNLESYEGYSYSEDKNDNDFLYQSIYMQDFIDHVKSNSDYLTLGYDSHLLLEKKISENYCKRSSLVKDYIKFIKTKVDILKNFQELKKKKMFEDVNLNLIFKIFYQIWEFFNILYEILEPLIDNYSNDWCFCFEIFAHFHKLKNYFISYNSKFDEIIRIIDRIEKDHIIFKEYLNQFASSNGIAINYFIQLPKRILTDSEVQLKEISKVTSKHHPDFNFLIEIISINSSVTNLLNKTEDQFIEAQNQLLIIKCIENPTIFKEGNRYRCVIDCMQFQEDEITCPKSLFIFDKTLVICKFKVPSIAIKRYQKLISKISNLNEPLSRFDEFSKSSSRQSLFSMNMSSSPTLSFKCVSRNSSLKSITSNTCIIKKRLDEGIQSAKFHKLFTGLSELNWSEKPENIYHISEVIEKGNITSVTSNVCDSNIIGQLFFTINYINKSGINRSMKLQLCPRVIKDMSKYKQIKIALPGHFEWEDVNIGRTVKWDEFILEEKRNFCNLFANHYEVELFEDEISHIIPNTSDAESNSDDLFKTPLSKKKNKTFLSNKSVNQFQSPTVKNNVISSGLRRLTKIFKRKSPIHNNLENQSSFFEQEEESTVLFNIESTANSDISGPIDYDSRRLKKRKSNFGIDHVNKNIKY